LILSVHRQTCAYRAMFSSKLLAITIVVVIVAAMCADANAGPSDGGDEQMRGRAVRAFSRYGKRGTAFSRYGKRSGGDHVPLACEHTGVADLYRCIEE